MIAPIKPFVNKNLDIRVTFAPVLSIIFDLLIHLSTKKSRSRNKKHADGTPVGVKITYKSGTDLRKFQKDQLAKNQINTEKYLGSSRSRLAAEE